MPDDIEEVHKVFSAMREFKNKIFFSFLSKEYLEAKRKS